VILACIFVVADANERLFEELDDRGDDFSFRESRRGQVCADPSA